MPWRLLYKSNIQTVYAPHVLSGIRDPRSHNGAALSHLKCLTGAPAAFGQLNAQVYA